MTAQLETASTAGSRLSAWSGPGAAPADVTRILASCPAPQLPPHVAARLDRVLAAESARSPQHGGDSR